MQARVERNREAKRGRLAMQARSESIHAFESSAFEDVDPDSQTIQESGLIEARNEGPDRSGLGRLSEKDLIGRARDPITTFLSANPQ